ncbi:MAG: alpha/beta fold hydrolase [Burkholderiaceae bacterium]
MAVIDIGGARLDVVRTGQGQGQKRDLVLLHSLLADRSVFDTVVPALAAEFRLTLVALPGYDGSDPAGSEIGGIADRVAGVFEACELPRDTALLGNGFGGFVALATAIRHGKRFGKLIVADSLATFPEPNKVPLRGLAGKVRAQGMAGAIEIALGRMFPPAFQQANPNIVAERKAALEKMNPAHFVESIDALVGLDFSADLTKIANPTLVMVGALDMTTPAPLVRELAHGIPGARFLEIADAGHCPQLEQPDAFTAAVKAFLKA